MGDEDEYILMSLRVTHEEARDYDKLVKAFKEPFTPRRNVIYLRTRFDGRCQAEHETVDAFVTDLHMFAEICVEIGEPLKSLARPSA